MFCEDFKSGHWLQQVQYKSFSPTRVNQQWQWRDPVVNTLLEQASTALAGLNTYSRIIPNVDLYIHLHVAKEAHASSRIEGTLTQLDEELLAQEFVPPEKRDDWQEVQNYTQAMNSALEKLAKLPLSNRLLTETHAILMQGVRGQHKSPGEFRRSQNWIGGTNLTNAIFIPPIPNEIPDLMGDLENLWHNENIQVPHLIRIAISHYQFETIHPFLDGNGRIGRLLITLYLIDQKLLVKPTLYLSDFFERHRGQYYDALTQVRHSHDLMQWLKFFLTAVIETANKGMQTFQAILKLREEVEAEILNFAKKAKNVQKLILLMYQRPWINAKIAAIELQSSHQTASLLLKQMHKAGLIKEITDFKRNRIYFFERYFKLFIQ